MLQYRSILFQYLVLLHRFKSNMFISFHLHLKCWGTVRLPSLWDRGCFCHQTSAKMSFCVFTHFVYVQMLCVLIFIFTSHWYIFFSLKCWSLMVGSVFMVVLWLLDYDISTASVSTIYWKWFFVFFCGLFIQFRLAIFFFPLCVEINSHPLNSTDRSVRFELNPDPHQWAPVHFLSGMWS